MLRTVHELPAGAAGPVVDPTGSRIEAGGGLPLFALALGIAGTLLGVMVVWFFAAIPLGIAAVVVGALALPRTQVPLYRSRAVIGIALGLVALVLGILSAILLPRVLSEADRALTGARDDVVTQIDKVDLSLTRNVNQLDGTITREMRELERQNHQEVGRLQKTSDGALRRLERRMAAAEKNLPARQKAELARATQQLRTQLAALETAMEEGSSTATAGMADIEARVRALEGTAPQPEAAAP